jgi:ABC-type protease/lipase transport system fused ATPase/permease subunit
VEPEEARGAANAHGQPCKRIPRAEAGPILVRRLDVGVRAEPASRHRPMSAPNPPALLEVRELTTEFRTDEGKLRAVDGVSFSLEAGRTLALVGESVRASR